MQYELTLPTDYDMRIIRHRVQTKGHALDERAGLGLKAYLIREAGVDGSPVNQYAPFYLWHAVPAMAHFLVGGGGFQNIVRDFGRPPVSHWTGLRMVTGSARSSAPRAASRRVADYSESAADLTALAGHPGLHTAAVAFDPRDWRLVRFALWRDEVPADEPATERYEVLHLSAPELDELVETSRTSETDPGPAALTAR
ncbi:DUF4865 family protein [Dactylosporangium fulvum]|uniref:DUF4865 family protein n=1 Tax=Dactylosporangium fulvum TaxID=53359 RepID=A0ABY5VNK7_9ACTN|nr:DUF4865 family protein [Dactylosporangium fulvum]UWP78702.1 DUF4865 family protein [Dactylosporangium fulvum]